MSSMLGRVLDEAAAREKDSANETSSLLPTSHENSDQTRRPSGNNMQMSSSSITSYGTGSSRRRQSIEDPTEEEEDGESTMNDDEDETLEDFDNSEDDFDEYKSNGLCQQCWNCLRALADVEDVWDSPIDHSHHSRRNKNLLVAFWFMVLATAYAGERSSFKFLVDQAGPFRLFSVEMVTGVHALLLGMGLLVSYVNHRRQVEQRRLYSHSDEPLGTPFEVPLGLPVVDVGLMAILDVVSLVMFFIGGIYVSPTLTVILVQFVLPLTALLMQFVHPDGRFSCCRTNMDSSRHPSEVSQSPGSAGAPGHRRDNSRQSTFSMESGVSDPPAGSAHNGPYDGATGSYRMVQNCAGFAVEHLWGSALISCACIFALIPSFYTIIDPDFFSYADTIPLRVAYNSLFFVAACIPAAASQLYKEHVFLQYRQPVNVHKLNSLLSVFEFIFASVLSPLVFTLQGLGSKSSTWYNLYPSSDFSENFLDGLKCFFRVLSEDDQLEKYPEEAQCDWVLLLTIFHAICIICVGMAVDKIVSAGSTKMTHRGISAGTILAVSFMAVYDFQIVEFSYGPFVDGLNLFCLILLILGSEIYHRVSLPDSTFETIYPTLDDIYDE